jgi:integrase
MREGLAEANPTLATNNPTEGMTCRERVLDDNEIAAVWRATADDEHSGRIVRLLMMTGCRRQEIGGLRWAEVNIDTGLLTIPGERTKNHRTLELPLPEPALAILRSVPRRDGCDFVFGKANASFSGWSVAKLRLDARIAMAEGRPLAAWRLHDLRRTMRTNLGKLGVAPHIAELTINHVKAGVEATYDKHRYGREIGAALSLWADHVLAIAEGREHKIIALAAHGVASTVSGLAQTNGAIPMVKARKESTLLQPRKRP